MDMESPPVEIYKQLSHFPTPAFSGTYLKQLAEK